ncbi:MULTISPECIES: phosphoribosylglycinamide formyltransferase [unclassified Actinomyces]|uniref:phosphoribosylglycinamide formyltransferase n=1 Tax=unclassified Actinomyces TaxID=2609248 RepID=UPI002017E728|nr:MULTISPECIES: phosphoribosylglycinamide formyltransferase [unclassified Actinomyces]MCL3778098.1 phosphoribosylglycinamide formyltransferase [Actinomyces sp. AC-20-1]MCL3788729.1 phosphoribosylglycinamide formyltransferase [Actinomyces sp. 187325]MCL3791797.1 phosphoribosylglycinamide formyltransferase [Actinomyces sp. 186855]MCL3794359.1 phosphoribosylglycinamide formyltransferase [Actinomyces sp. 217892]
MSTPARLVVLVSGTGSNLAALLAACEEDSYGARVVGVVTDKECPAADLARAAAVPVAVVPLSTGRDPAVRAAWDLDLAAAVGAHRPDLVVCAGFMRLLGTGFLNRFEGRVLNTHPSLLPAFHGAHAVRDALAAGARRTGATLFWVDEGVDTGAHVAQVEVPVLADDDEAALTARVKAVETPQLVEHVGRLARQAAARPR